MISFEQLDQVIEKVRSIGSDVVVHDITENVLSALEGGKIRMKSRIDVRSLGDLQRIYTLSVACVCLDIQANPEKSRYFKSIGNSVTIVTDGTVIWRLGNNDHVAEMPVMEGKAVLFDQYVGIS